MIIFHSAGLKVTVCLVKLKMHNYNTQVVISTMNLYLNVLTSGIISGSTSCRLRLRRVPTL